MEAGRFFTRSLREPRVARILASAINAVEPGMLVRDSIPLIPMVTGRYYALGIGKAAQAMTRAVADALPLEDALVITKHAAPVVGAGYTIIEAGHPIPDQRSLQAGAAALAFASRLREDDLLICLISGGGSALASAPTKGVALQDLRFTTDALLASGASIHEINVVRRELDALKGGGLAAATQARVIGLLLSDVPGNPIEAIASGPTAAGHPGPLSPQQILRKYDITAPESISRALLAGPPRRTRRDGQRVRNYVIADVATAVNGARLQADLEGFDSTVLGRAIHGEARLAGLDLARALIDASQHGSRPFCLIGGGETTVTIQAPGGAGGRNQELALAAVEPLAGLPDVMFITLATDGEDGTTDAAGAVVTGESHQRGKDLGLRPVDFLSRNHSYRYFDRLGDLLRPGPTGTNVNDLMLLVGL